MANCSCDIICKDDEKHCCECEKVYKSNLTHCSKCCESYDKEYFTHCCECNLFYPNDNFHCHECGVVYDVTEENHCCNCKKLYSVELTHCDRCCNLYDDLKMKHCCNCMENYDINSFHCCKCKNNYQEKYHCCGCKVSYSENTKHCSECHQNYDSSETHDCGLKDYDALVLRIRRLMNSLNKNYMINPCLKKKCKSVTKFFSTNKMDFKNLWFAYHGTKTPAVEPICCGGWDIGRRSGQAYGRGEYFSKYFPTADMYAKGGYIILSLLVKEKSKYVSTGAHLGEIYVVDNTPTDTYCLPVAIIECDIPLLNFSCPKKK